MAVVKAKNGHAVAIKINKQLLKQADIVGVNIRRAIENEIYKKYKDNVEKSYAARSQRGQEIEQYNKAQAEIAKNGYGTTHRKTRTYHHSGIFARAIDTEVNDNIVRVIIKNDEIYSNGTTPSDVYKWLTEGTGGGGYYPYVKHVGNNKSDPASYKTGWAYNYPTPKHDFDLHTYEQMKPVYQDIINILSKAKTHPSAVAKTLRSKYNLRKRH